MHFLFRFPAVTRRNYLLLRHYKAAKKPPPLPTATPPKAPKKPQNFSFHEVTWEDPYSWMSNLNDKVAMRHMDVYMEQEEKYTEAVMSDSERILNKLHFEMASRIPFELSTPPLRWGPWFVLLLVVYS
jgi:protease II